MFLKKTGRRLIRLQGSDKVGAQLNDLSLPRRVQLAVVAHIRHTYTDYDELLKEIPWAEARKKVTDQTLEKLAVWRGDQDDGHDQMEDILCEVIVLSDDEDEFDEGMSPSHRIIASPKTTHAEQAHLLPSSGATGVALAHDL